MVGIGETGVVCVVGVEEAGVVGVGVTGVLDVGETGTGLPA